MTIWDELTPEESTIMINALEEAYLNGVIGDFLGGPLPSGGWISSSDTDAIRALIPRFANTVREMIRRNLIEIREVYDTWDSAPPMTDADVHAALTDPATWLWSPNRDNRMLMTTDLADRLLGRLPLTTTLEPQATSTGR